MRSIGDDRLLAVTTIGFDIAALELYLPLISGACVAVTPGETVQDVPALARHDRGERRDDDAGARRRCGRRW